MSDSRPGSRTWQRALNTLFEPHPTIYPASVDIDGARGWLCRHDVDFAPTAGYGITPEEAYVDYVEEVWCLSGSFPKGYPG